MIKPVIASLVLIILSQVACTREKPVARILGKDISREDCLSPSAGIGSPAVGLEFLVQSAMMDEFGKSEPIALTADDFKAYFARSAEVRARMAKSDRQPAAVPFDVHQAEKRLAEVREKLGKKGLHLLERRVLEQQEKASLACIEYGSQDAEMALAMMPTLKFYGAIHRKYGGSIHAAGLVAVPTDAMDQLRADMEKSGKIVILDEALGQELKTRAKAIRNPATVVPAEKVSFRWPFFLDFEVIDASGVGKKK